jgi:glutathione synthase/RimK-type ligase-like ATP-grasp enzyme
MFRTNPIVDRVMDFFGLPSVYWQLVKWPDCERSPLGLASDLLTWFFVYRTFPDNYGPCRLWEVSRSDWKYYYGSNYRTYQRAALRKKVQPPRYAIVFEDKALCEDLCTRDRIALPRTLGVIRPDQEYRKVLSSWLEHTVGDGLIIKPLYGAAGRGIVVLKKKGESMVVSSKSADLRLEEWELEGEAIVQKVVEQDKRMAAFSSRSLNTFRVVSMLTQSDEILILGATMRCGVGDSYVDNWSAGGVAVGVAVDKGILSRYAYDKYGRRYIEHPTTHVRFEGFAVPAWDEILNLARRIQKLFPYYRILGMDIALSEGAGPILIEINDNTDLLFQEQTSGPLLKQEPVLRAFGEYGLLINSKQLALLAHSNT